VERCPRCGYHEGADWPDRLVYLAFVILWLGFAFPDHVSKRLEVLRLVALALVIAGIAWKSNRKQRLEREHEKLHPPIAG
jgi:hypothetical protein